MADGTERQVRSACRFCVAACGTVLSLDEDGRLLQVRGDRDHPLSKGYACIKGLQAPEAANGPDRLLRPLKRRAEGGFEEIALETALDEIAARTAEIMQAGGPRAIASYRGVMTAFNCVADQILGDWMIALGSPSYFTNYTIDQSAKGVTAGRMGAWNAGHHDMADCDVMMLVGTNPLVALATGGFVNFNATKQIKAAKARGMRIVVIDPRRSETAVFADVHLRPRPGEDATLLAGMIRLILAEGWHDAGFCDRHLADLDALQAAVEPFTPQLVEARAEVPEAELRAAARLFALEARRGFATTSTGVTMAPRSNLIDHLTQTLNVICGRFRREGDTVANPGILSPRRPYRAEVVPPSRTWKTGHQGRTGFGTMRRTRASGLKMDEMMTCTMADEILLPGEGQIRALFVQAGNPVASLPDFHKTIRAFQSLDLLVAVEPYLTPTARLAHYVLPPKTQYERDDFLLGPHYERHAPVPFAQFTPAVTPVPAGSDLVDDWYVYWALAKRLGRPLSFAGVPLDMEMPPTTRDLLDLLGRHSQIPVAEVCASEGGRIYDLPAQVVEPGQGSARFECAPADVQAEIADALSASTAVSERYPFALMSRRMREVYNSFGIHFAEVKKRCPFNPLWMHPEDMARLGLEAEARVAVTSPNGAIPAIVAADDTMKPGTVAMSHGWGRLPEEHRPYEDGGSNTNELISIERCREDINAMAWMSVVPVRIEPAAD